MKYTLIDNVDATKFDSFVYESEKSHFSQTAEFGEIRSYANWQPIRVAMLDENENIVATALLLKKNLISKYCYIYIPRGFILDYHNNDLIKKFTNKLIEYCRSINAIYFKIDPDIKRHTLNIKGEIIEGENNYALIEYLQKLGYKHRGYNNGFELEAPRFTFRLDLTDGYDQVYKRYHDTTRKILNRGNKYNLDLYVGDENDIPAFYQVMKETFSRKNISAYPEQYYLQFLNILHQKNMGDIYMCKVDTAKLKQTFQQQLSELNDKITETETKAESSIKIANKLNDMKIQYEKMEKEYQQYKDLPDEIIPISSIITAKFKDMVWTIHGGNNTEFIGLNANYLVYNEIIKDACQQGYKKIDFFGCLGNPESFKGDSEYGIHTFKARLNGEYTEFIGEFDYPVSKILYYGYRLLIPVYHKLKK